MLLKEDLPRGVWKMGKITEQVSSNDGKIRAAKVLLSNQSAQKTLNLLYSLECDSGREIEMTQDGEQLNESEEITSSTLRPTRAAATRTREQDTKTLFFRNRNFLLA